jgi:hypothetical protein
MISTQKQHRLDRELEDKTGALEPLHYEDRQYGGGHCLFVLVGIENLRR